MNANEMIIIGMIAERLPVHLAIRGLFDILHDHTQQALLAKIPNLLVGFDNPDEIQQAIDYLKELIEQEQS